MLKDIFKKLDTWIDSENQRMIREGLVLLKQCEFRIVGQNALLEAKLNLQIAATADLDAIDNANYVIRNELNKLLKMEGMELDPLSNEIWMPDETEYIEIFSGDWVVARRALPVYVLVSKTKYAVEKNKLLIREYIAKDATDRFFELCEKYQVDLEAVFR